MDNNKNDYPIMDDDGHEDGSVPVSTFDDRSRQAATISRERKSLSWISLLLKEQQYQGVEPQPPFELLKETTRLGESTLLESAQYRDERGVIPLIGGQYYEQRLESYAAEGVSVDQVMDLELARERGIAAALWGLDFIQFHATDPAIAAQHIQFGLGPTNKAVTWEEDSAGNVRARLPFDNANSFHRNLAAQTEHIEQPQSLELVMPAVPQEMQDLYLGLRVIPS